jgi:hypothetical protein
MAWRFTGRARVNPRAPESFAVCDRCSKWYNIGDLSWQFQYAGPQLQNLRLLVCRQCLDVPQPQLKPRILPPDPMPTLNARPENFLIDDYDLRATEDTPVQNIVTEDSIPVVTQNVANNREDG